MQHKWYRLPQLYKNVGELVTIPFLDSDEGDTVSTSIRQDLRDVLDREPREAYGPSHASGCQMSKAQAMKAAMPWDIFARWWNELSDDEKQEARKPRDPSGMR